MNFFSKGQKKQLNVRSQKKQRNVDIPNPDSGIKVLSGSGQKRTRIRLLE